MEERLWRRALRKCKAAAARRSEAIVCIALYPCLLKGLPLLWLVIEARHRPRPSRAFFPAPAATPTLFEELQLFISTSIRGHTSFIPATLPPEHASLVPPGRCPEDATSTQRWGSCSNRGFLHFFGMFSFVQFSKHRPVVPLAATQILGKHSISRLS